MTWDDFERMLCYMVIESHWRVCVSHGGKFSNRMRDAALAFSARWQQ